MSLSPAFIWNAVAIALGVIGGVLFLWAMFWDRARGRLRCPKCWYDMRGVAAQRPPYTCPECGSVAKSAKRLRKTKRRTRTAVIAVLIAWIGIYGWTAVDRIVARGWMGAVPTSVLLLWPLDHAGDILVKGSTAKPRIAYLGMRIEFMHRQFNEELTRFDYALYRLVVDRKLHKYVVRGLTPQDRAAFRAFQRSGAHEPWGKRARFYSIGGITAALRAHDPVHGKDTSLSRFPYAEIDGDASIKIPEGWDVEPGVGWSNVSISETTVLDFGLSKLVIGPVSSHARLEHVLREIRTALRSGRVSPEQSSHDLDTLRALRSVPVDIGRPVGNGIDAMPADSMAVAPALVLLATLTNQRVIEPGGGRHDDPVRMDGVTNAAELGDAIADAMTLSWSQRIVWTFSQRGIEFGTRHELSHVIETRAYSIKPIVRGWAKGRSLKHVDWQAECSVAAGRLAMRASRDGWLDNGGNVHMLGPLIMVRTTPAIHGRVAEFFDEYAAQEREPILKGGE